jgi:hypothetical protein
MKRNPLTGQTEAVPVMVESCPKFLLGQEFTIKGIRLLPDGSFITTCEPGEETILIQSDEPSIYRLRK